MISIWQHADVVVIVSVLRRVAVSDSSVGSLSQPLPTGGLHPDGSSSIPLTGSIVPYF